MLLAAASDESPLVRAEAIKAAVEFQNAASAEVIFEAATHPMDPELTNVLKYARSQINVDQMIVEAVRSGRKLSPAATSYALEKASTDLLLKLDRTDAVYRAILSRGGVAPQYRLEALRALASQQGNRSVVEELLSWITKAENENLAGLNDLAQMLPKQSPADLAKVSAELAKLAATTQTPLVRRAVYQSWILGGGADAAWEQASQSPTLMADLLRSAKQVNKSDAAASLLAKIRPLMFELPANLRPESESAAKDGPAVAFDHYAPHPAQNVAIETLNAVKPTLSGRMKNFNKYVPKGKQDEFATKMTTSVIIPVAGNYKFFIASDDGSRLYLNGAELINNDGLHGMVEKSGSASLSTGPHELVVTYFDNGGGDGLRVMWEGPGIKKQPIPTSALRPAGQVDLRVAAIDAVTSWPCDLKLKIADFAMLSTSGDLSDEGLKALSTLPPEAVAAMLSNSARDAVLNSLLSLAKDASPVEKQSDQYAALLTLGDTLVAKTTTNRNAISKSLVDLRNSIPVKADPKVMALGKEVFTRESHCATCHQVHGQGMPNLYPPIDGSLWATGSEDRLIALALDGMHGTIEVKGKTYSSPPLPPMTGFRQLLNDEELAAVLTYVRNSWTNRAKPIEPSQVAKIRAIDRGDATFWHVNDLMAKYPLEDGRKPIESQGDQWVPKFVKEWKLADLDAKKVNASQRNFAVGQVYFNRLGCAQCHAMNDKGGNFGPDLAKLIDKKRTASHVLESILDPSKEIDEKYRMQTILTIDGKVVSGLVVADNKDEIRLITDPLNPNKPTIIKKEDIDDQSATATTIMPSGMMNWLTEEEIYDLTAFVLSGGNSKDKMFQAK